MSDNSSLNSRRIVVTRPETQSASLIEALRQRGAVPIPFPVIRIEPLADVPGLERALCNLAGYDWLVFTSVNGVQILWEWLRRLNISPQTVLEQDVAAIGPATADELRARGVSTIFVPEDYVGEALGEGIPQAAGKRILLPRAAGSRPALARILTGRGAEVDEFALYRAIQAEATPETLAQLTAGVDAITFTSPSTVRHFTTILTSAFLNPLDLPGAPVAACIGPITAEAAEQAGYLTEVVAETYNVEGLLKALVQFLGKRETV
ncbi:MAG: uroporphyrinogen-III synthase [Anaerolineales bacterium]